MPLQHIQFSFKVNKFFKTVPHSQIIQIGSFRATGDKIVEPH